MRTSTKLWIAGVVLLFAGSLTLGIVIAPHMPKDSPPQEKKPPTMLRPPLPSTLPGFSG